MPSTYEYADFDRTEFPKNSFAGEWKQKREGLIKKRVADANKIRNCEYEESKPMILENPILKLFNEHVLREIRNRTKSNTEINKFPNFIDDIKIQFESFLLSSKYINSMNKLHIKPLNDLIHKIAILYVNNIYNSNYKNSDGKKILENIIKDTEKFFIKQQNDDKVSDIIFEQKLQLPKSQNTPIIRHKVFKRHRLIQQDIPEYGTTSYARDSIDNPSFLPYTF